MNYNLNHLPVRISKPRESGYTMAMDKGLSIREVEDFIEVAADYVDIVKLGWATSYVVPNLKRKLEVYQAAGIPVYFGGTLFEAFVVRNQFDDYRRLLDHFGMTFAEVSDGSIELEHDIKCTYIRTLAANVTVLSEVGSKDAEKIIPPYKWIKLMQAELDAGAWKVIGEAREDIYFNIGLTYQSWGKFKAAAKYYKMCLQVNLENEMALQELIYCLEITGNIEDSLPFFQEFIDANPYSHLAWFNMGLVYSKAGEFEKAINAYEYAIIIKPDFAAAFLNMANNHVYLGHFAKAIEGFNAFIEHDEPSADVYCNIGECYEKLRQWDIARRYYQKSIDLNPEMDEAWFGIGVILDLQGKWYEAVHFYKKACTLYGESPEYWLALAAAEYNLGNVLSSIESYEKASLIAPTNKDVWLNWSIILYEQGNHEGAIDLMHNAIEVQPDEAELHYRMCAYLLSAGKYKEAYNYLENALILDFDKHRLLFEFFPELESQRALARLIDQYRK